MATKAAYKRLSKEYVVMQREPPPFVWAAPDEKDILTWNYIIHGPPDSPFTGGEYHGVLLFPSEYPFKPPGIKMYTPSGRFQPDKKICFSMSDFHPGSWNPAWSVATILTGLVSFMLSDEMTTGSVTTSDAEKRLYAARSHAWNIEQRRFKEAFPEYCTPTLRPLPNMGEKERGKPDTPTVASPSTASSPRPVVPSMALAATNAVIPQKNLGARSRKVARPGVSGPTANPGDASRGWAATWRQVVWEKWRWGVLIALAVVVSRITSSA
ncbi:UBC-like protein [Artomyces pyxidatus]|uniref:UBC-like protein n=1 Tax=Artomyces pyxidatus TaxID=48021 RepID=A0ACB8T5L8_9AGAM|nr:UBC-like protein [Artomyces pyxidatus]